MKGASLPEELQQYMFADPLLLWVSFFPSVKLAIGPELVFFELVTRCTATVQKSCFQI